MQNFYALTIDDLTLKLSEWKIPRFRRDQIWNWVYTNGVSDFDQMNNLPKKLRTRLKEHFVLGTAEVDIEQKSEDGTVKRLYRLPDDTLIESVLMPYRDGRRTACISSQVGCAMACRFCATGQMGFVRQLLPEEIFEQALRFSMLLQQKEERLSNIVLMGMGEPFHNYNAVLKAIDMIRTRLGNSQMKGYRSILRSHYMQQRMKKEVLSCRSTSAIR
jgi:23S rRNA (adenine2503-C2)-methyltransferase